MSDSLDRTFWLIILGTWDVETIAVLSEYAAECERTVSWDYDTGKPRFGTQRLG